MRAIAARIAKVVLHVADDRVVPIGEIERAVGSDFEVRRPEVRIAGGEQWLDFRGGKAGALVRYLVLQDALKANHVADEQSALHRLGKVAARKILDAGAGPRARLVDRRGHRVLARKLDVTRKQRRVEGNRAGAVHDDILSPVVEGV